MSYRAWLPLLAMLGLAACELIVDFDSDSEGTLMPTPIGTDGAVAVVVDGSAGDGTVVRFPVEAGARDGGERDAESDAAPSPGVPEAGAEPDASDGPPEPLDASANEAGQGDGAADVKLDAAPADAAADAAATEDASDGASDDASDGASDSMVIEDATASGPTNPEADAASDAAPAASEDASLLSDGSLSDTGVADASADGGP